MAMAVVDLDLVPIICHLSAFLSAVALFQYGADTFTRHTAILARRAGIPEAVVTLIATTGAELEELSIIVATLIQNKSSLGLGNIIGSTIGNVLGAFSLVLLFHDGPLEFDRGATVFASVSFIMTSLFSILTWGNEMGTEEGISLLVAFSVYIFSIGSAVYEGFIKPLDLINDVNFRKNETAVDEENTAIDDEELLSSFEENTGQDLSIVIFPSVIRCSTTETLPTLLSESHETDGLLQKRRSNHDSKRMRRRFVFHNATKVLLGMFALILSGLVATYSVAALAIALNISNFIAGLTILSFAAPLPERIIKFSYNRRLHSDVLMASTAGTNIVLLTLCMGIVLVTGDDDGNDSFDGDIIGFELLACWGCSFVLLIITWFGGRPWIGGLLLVCYCIFLVCELTIFRR